MKLNIIESNNYLSYDYVISILPTKYKRAFDKAYKWEPKLKSWTYNASQSAEAVAIGQKPLVFGYKNNIMHELAATYGLEYKYGDDEILRAGSLFKPENEDLADLVAYVWGKFGITSPITHYVTGTCLGYPTRDVYNFSSQYINPSDELKAGLNNHHNGNIIR